MQQRSLRDTLFHEVVQKESTHSFSLEITLQSDDQRLSIYER